MSVQALSSLNQSPAPDQRNVLDVHERIRLIRDGMVNYSGFLIAGLVGIALVPIMLKGLGAEQYGLWIAALAVATMVRSLDFGLGWSVTREVARGSVEHDQTVQFVSTAARAYVVLGLMDIVIVAGLCLQLLGSLQLQAESREVAPTVFWLAGVTVLGDQVLAFVASVLSGLRRFDASNLLTIVSVLLRAAGIILLLKGGAGLVAVAVWQVVAAGITALAGFWLLKQIEPRLRFRLGSLNWQLLRLHMSFGLASLLSAIVSKILWEIGPVLIGVVLGSLWIAPYHIGQKFPLALSFVSWRIGEVLFPRAGAAEVTRDEARAREILDVGTRWIIVLMLPLCLVLAMLAPDLLQVWVGEARPSVLGVMQLMVAVVLVDAFGVTAVYLLWGGGRARIVLAVLSGMAVAHVVLGLWLVGRLGIPGMACGMLISVVFGSAFFARLASRQYGFPVSQLLRTVAKGLSLPTLACAVTTYGIRHLLQPERWVEVLGIALAGGLAYVTTLYLGGAREEERVLARQVLKLPLTVLRLAYRGLPR